jgi:glucose/arabinose dehydrogenase
VQIPTTVIGLLLAASFGAGCGPSAEGGQPAPSRTANDPAVAKLPAWKQPPIRPHGPRPATEKGHARNFKLKEIGSGFKLPNQLITRPGSAGLYVVEQGGTIRRIVSGRPEAVPFLDIRGSTRASGEQGLLSAVFSPDGDSIVAMYTNRRGNTRVVSFAVGGGIANPREGTVLLRVKQPHENHNGGTVLFDERDRLLLSLGDGGSHFDPGNRGQDERSLFGAILRYEDGHWQKIVRGLRNPWRMSLDPETGLLWIGDVGQDRFEEINAIYPPEQGQPQLNLGWAAYEGHLPVGRKQLGSGRLVWPVAGYSHEQGQCSVTGGAVYRGDGIEALRGRYLFGDFCRGTLWTLRASGTENRADVDLRREQARVPGLSSFGADEDGELYVLSTQGTVSKIVPL